MKCNHKDSMCVQLVPIFNHLKTEQLKQIMDLSITKTYKKGDLIFSAGSKAENLYIVSSGTVKVYTIDESGKQHLLYVLNQGDYIGEISLFLSSEHTNFAESVTDATICSIYKDDLMELLSIYPDISIKILEEFASRLKSSQTQAKRISVNSTDTRLALYLLENANYTNNKLISTLTMKRKDLALYLGMSAETISRKFKQFEESKLLKQINTKEIEILDKDKLSLL